MTEFGPKVVNCDLFQSMKVYGKMSTTANKQCGDFSIRHITVTLSKLILNEKQTSILDSRYRVSV